MLRAELHKPVRKDLAETAERPSDEIAAVRFDFEFRRDWLAAPGDKRLRKRHNNFADMLPASHKPKCRIDVTRRKRAERQWSQGALFDEVGDLREHLSGERFV